MMSSSLCRVCRRHLRNPLSIELGIGPVCRGKGGKQSTSKQGELDFTLAETAFQEHESGEFAKGVNNERTDQGRNGNP